MADIPNITLKSRSKITTVFFVRQMRINILSVYGCLLTCIHHFAVVVSVYAWSFPVGIWVDLWVWECIFVVVAVVLVGGQGTVLCSRHWQVVIYKPHHKLLACGPCRASGSVCCSVQHSLVFIYLPCYGGKSCFSNNIRLLIACCAQPCVPEPH